MLPVTLDHVTKAYFHGHASVAAVSDVSLSIAEGAFVAVAGRSGSGKTTLLNLIGAMETPTSGAITVGEHALDKKSETELALFRRHHVGVIFQMNNLFSALTVFENVEFPLLLLGEKQRKAKVLDLLEKTGLWKKRKHLPHQLSGGEQQRVAIARALIHGPSVVLADEPTAHLDTHTAADLLALLNQLHQDHRATIFLATHDPEMIRRCREVIRLEDGKMVL